MINRERVQYVCARCGRDINTKRLFVLMFDKVEKDDNGRLNRSYLNPFNTTNTSCLCGKCSKDLKAFMSNSYPYDKSEREELLERKLIEIGEELSEKILRLKDGASYISFFARDLEETITTPRYKSLDMLKENLLKESEAGTCRQNGA